MTNPEVASDIDDLVQRILTAPATEIAADMQTNVAFMESIKEWVSKMYLDDEVEEVLPMWVILTRHGQIVHTVTPFTGENMDEVEISKNFVASKVREIMARVHAIRYAFISEAWMVSVTDDEWAKDKRQPSEREDKKEVANIVIGDETGDIAFAYELIRDWQSGKITELKPLYEGEDSPTGYRGRFTNMLS